MTMLSFSATLKDSRNGELVGEAIYKEAKVAPGVVTQSLKISIKGQAPNTELKIMINNHVAGRLKTDRDGKGAIELHSVRSRTSPNGVSLPMIRPTNVITVGTSKGEF
jgi:hypothetical protein